MYCPSCSTKATEGAKFCKSCGMNLNIISQALTGGSFGVAIVATFVQHRAMSHRTALLSHLTLFDNTTQERIHAVMASMLARGSSWGEMRPCGASVRRRTRSFGR